MSKRVWFISAFFLATTVYAAEPSESLAIDYQVTNVDVVDENETRSIQISATGEIEGFGHVRGTATFYDVTADSKGGPAVWRAMAMGPEGLVTDIAPGSWQQTGTYTFRLRNISSVSDGTALLGDSVVDIKTGTIKGAAAVLD